MQLQGLVGIKLTIGRGRFVDHCLLTLYLPGVLFSNFNIQCSILLSTIQVPVGGSGVGPKIREFVPNSGFSENCPDFVLKFGKDSNVGHYFREKSVKMVV